jgi:hypothetical protein
MRAPTLRLDSEAVVTVPKDKTPYMRTCIHTYIHKHTYMLLRADYINSYIHRYTYMHIHTHIYIHYIHIWCAYACVQVQRPHPQGPTCDRPCGAPRLAQVLSRNKMGPSRLHICRRLGIVSLRTVFLVCVCVCVHVCVHVCLCSCVYLQWCSLRMAIQQ